MNDLPPGAVEGMESRTQAVKGEDHSTPRRGGGSYSDSDLDALLAEERNWQADQASPQDWK